MSTFWTARIVNEHLVQAFRSIPGHAVFTTAGTVRPYDVHPSVAEAFSWAVRFLDTYPRARKHLYAWARCRAQGESWRAMCEGMSWPHSTAEASRKLAAEVIAEGLNGETSQRAEQGATMLSPENA